MRSEQGADQPVEIDEFALAAEGRADSARLIAKAVEGLWPVPADQIVQTGFELGTAQGPADVPAAAAGRNHIIQEGPGLRRQTQAADEGLVGIERLGASPRAKGEARQFDIALAVRDDEHGSIGRRRVLKGGSIGDQRAWGVGRDDGPEIAANDMLRWIDQVLGVQTRADLTDGAFRAGACDHVR